MALLFFYIIKYKKAIENIDKAIIINNNIYYYYLLKADICSSLSNFYEEEENFKKAIDLKKNAYLYYSNLIDSLNAESSVNLVSFYFKQFEKLKSICK